MVTLLGTKLCMFPKHQHVREIDRRTAVIRYVMEMIVSNLGNDNLATYMLLQEATYMVNMYVAFIPGIEDLVRTEHYFQQVDIIRKASLKAIADAKECQPTNRFNNMVTTVYLPHAVSKDYRPGDMVDRRVGTLQHGDGKDPTRLWNTIKTKDEYILEMEEPKHKHHTDGYGTQSSTMRSSLQNIGCHAQSV